MDHHPFYGSNLLTDPNCHTHCKGWTLRFRVVNESRHPVYVEDVDVAYAVNGQPPSGGERLYSAGGPISFVRPGMLPRRLRLDQHGGYSFESRVTGPDLVPFYNARRVTVVISATTDDGREWTQTVRPRRSEFAPG